MSLKKAKLKSIRDIKTIEKLAHYAEELDGGLPFSTFSTEPAIAIPIKQEFFQQSMNISARNQNKKNALIQLDAKSDGIDFKTLNDLTLRSAEKMFQTNLDKINVNFRAAIDCLVLCENTGTYCQVVNLETKPGSFGYMLFNLPIENESSEAMATIKYKTEIVIYQLKPNSVMAVSGPRHNQGRQDLEVKPANGGRCAILVFHLVWTDAFLLGSFMKPDAFSTFIRAASEAHEALKAWIQPLSEQASAPSAASKKGPKFITTGHEINSSPLSSQIDAATTKFLCVPLLYNYSPYNLKMKKLQGIDLFISQVLKSIDYIDVHFAVLSGMSKGYKSLKRDNYTKSALCESRVSRGWVEHLSMTWSSSHSNLKNVSLEKALVWYITSELTDSRIRGEAVVPLATLNSNKDSDAESCKSGTSIQIVHSTIDARDDESCYEDSSSEMYTTLNRPQATKPKIQHNIYSTSDLSSEETESEEEDDYYHRKYNMCYKCEDDAESVPGNDHAVLLIEPKWNRASTANIEDTLKGLKTHLNDALSQMASGKLKENDHFNSNFEQLVSQMCNTKELSPILDVLNMATRLRKIDAGIEILKLMADNKAPSQDIDTVPYLTDFILIAGWESCSDHVLRMMDISHSSFALLGKRLYYLRCLDGAGQLAEKIIEKMSPGNHEQHGLNLVASIVELVCLLQAEEAASETCYASLLNYLKKHDMDTLKRVFAIVQKSTLEKELLSKVTADLRNAFACIRLNEITELSFVSIIREYGHHSGDSKVSDNLMKQLFDEVESQQPDTFLHRLIIWLELEDEDRVEILEQMSRYRNANQVLDSAFEAYVNKFLVSDIVDEDDLTQFQWYLMFLSLAENEMQPISPKRLCLIEKLMTSLLPDERLSIVTNFLRNANRKQFTAGEKKIYGVLWHVIIQSPIGDLYDDPDSFSNLFYSLLRFEDKFLMDSLVHKLTNGKDGCDGLILLDCFKSIFSSERFTTLELKRISTLLENWATSAAKFDAVVVNEHVPLIFKAYYQAERSGATDAEISVLIHQMLPQVVTNSLKCLVVQIEDKHQLKTLPSCFNVFKEICAELSKRADFPQACLEREATHLERLILCFLWLEDEKSVTELFKILTSIAPISKLHDTKLNILKSAGFLEAARSSSFALKLFDEVVDDYIKKMNDMVKTPGTWALPNTVVPRDPKMQQVLRANVQHCFLNYKTKQGAEGFGKRITSLNVSWGLQYAVKMTTPGEYRCEITKTRMFPGKVQYIHGVTNELPKLMELKKALYSSEEPPSKRLKV